MNIKIEFGQGNLTKQDVVNILQEWGIDAAKLLSVKENQPTPQYDTTMGFVEPVARSHHWYNLYGDFDQSDYDKLSKNHHTGILI